MASERGLSSPELGWLEELRIDDAYTARAYEQTDPRLRALLKRGMQLGHLWYGAAQSSREELRRELLHAGASLHTRTRPLDWTMLLLPGEVEASARVLALALLPLLAGVPDVFAVLPCPDPSPAPLLALELSGVQDIFCLNATTLSELLNGLKGRGRVLTLCGDHLPLPPSHPPLLAEKCLPHLSVLNPELFSKTDLRFLHGDVPLEEAVSEKTAAVLGSEKSLERVFQDGSCEDCLLLPPGLEGFWLWQDLSPRNFRCRTVQIQEMAEEEDEEAFF